VNNSFNKISKILKLSPEYLLALSQKMDLISGQTGVIDSISNQNDVLVDKTLSELGLSRDSYAEDVHEALVQRVTVIDELLYELLERPDLSTMSNVCGKLCETALKVYTPQKGLFIKKEKVVELLEKQKPDNMLKHFSYSSSQELVDKEGFSSVVSALRFTQSTEWMHKFFSTAYKDLKSDDFEERDVEIKILEDKWLEVADKFLEKKYHNVSHLKEYGVIFIIPLKTDTPGETMRMFALLLHYLHEVPFYSSLFRRFLYNLDFISKFQALLRGDVPEGAIPDDGDGKIVWRVVQRYLAKEDENDFRLLEQHVNPEAEHWFRVGQDLGRLARMTRRDESSLTVDYWKSLDCVGDFFKNKNGEEVFISFDLMDLTMSLVRKGQVKYSYHQREALWNKIFFEYVGRERMNQFIEDNIINGFIEL